MKYTTKINFNIPINYIIILLFNFISKYLTTSEIKLVISGQGNQAIISESFYKEPNQVFVNDILREDCKRYCQLNNDINNITIKFEDEITSCENMFNGLTNLIKIDLSNFDNSKVTNMSSMFQNCKNLAHINLGEINTSSVEDMSYLFEHCEALTSIDLYYFDTSSVTNMNYMFSHCDKIKFIDASSFNTTNVEKMQDLFSYNEKMITVDVSSFDTSNTKNMRALFYCCPSLKYVNLQNFDTSSTTTISHIFGHGLSLNFLNLKNFIISNDIDVSTFEETFIYIPNSANYCLEDESTKTKLIGQTVSDCNDTCFQENMKFDMEENTCKESCNEEQYELNKECYNQNPDNNKIFYKDNDNIYKVCHYLCQSCSKSGNKTNHNCDICKNDYIFLNDSESIPQNCYKQCDYYYYFDENNNYFCSQSYICPINYNKLIEPKKKCIDDCKRDNEYIFDYNNHCISVCPENTKIYNEEKKCLDTCYSNQIEYKGMCYNNLPNDTYELFQNGNIFVNNNTNFNDLLNNILLSLYIPEIGKSLLIERPDETIYQITNTKNELELLKNKSNNINNISIIELAQCEMILKKQYNINENDSLIFIKNEYKTNKASDKKVNFEVYEPYNKTKLNLSFCDDTPINLYIPIELSQENKQIYEKMKEAGYDMFDINDPFYQDVCTPFDSANGTDILLSDRVDYIYNNDDTQCQPNCQFSQYSMESQYLSCSCSVSQDISNNNEKKDKFSAKKLYESFYDVLKYSNYDIIKCANIIGDIKTIITNIGSIMTISYFLCYLISFGFFIFSGITPLKNKLRNNLEQIKIEGIFDFNSNIQIYLNPPNKKPPIRKLILRRDLEKRNQTLFKKKNIKINLNNPNNLEDKIQIYPYNNSNSNLNNSPPSDKFSDLKLKTSLQNIKKEIIPEKKKEYSDYELNELEYNEAIILDQRSLLQVYWASLKREHLIFFTFFNCNDYNLLSIKLSRFIFLIVGDMALNVFFFSDDSMHKLFINYGKYDFFQQIPQITYSTIISQLIEIFLCFLSLTDKYIYKIKSYIENRKKEKIPKIMKCICAKLIFFYVFTFIVFGMYWYIISVFCGVYRNTQKTFIKDSIISFCICLAYPLILYFISACLRICSLRTSKKNLKYVYKLSYMIPIF